MRRVFVVACALALGCAPTPPDDAGAFDDGGAPPHDGGIALDDGGEPADGPRPFDGGEWSTDNPCPADAGAAPVDGGPPPAMQSRALSSGTLFEVAVPSPDGKRALLWAPDFADAVLVDLESGAERHLASELADIYGVYDPRFSPDGVWVVFRAYGNAVTGIYRRRADLSDEPSLFGGPSAALLGFDRSGARALLASWEQGLYVHTLDDGAGTRLDGYAYSAYVTPDDERVVYYRDSGEWRVAPIGGGAPITLGSGFNVLPTTLTDDRVAAVASGGAALVEVSLADGSAVEIAPFSYADMAVSDDGSVLFRMGEGGRFARWRADLGLVELHADLRAPFRATADGETLLYLKGTAPDVELRAVDGRGARALPWLLTDRALASLDVAIGGTAKGRSDAFVVRERQPAGRELMWRSLDGCGAPVVVAQGSVCSVRPTRRGGAGSWLFYVDTCPGDLLAAWPGGSVVVAEGARDFWHLPGGDELLVRDEGDRLLHVGPGVDPGLAAPEPACGDDGDGGTSDAVIEGSVYASSLAGIDRLRRLGVTEITGVLQLSSIGVAVEIDLPCLRSVGGELQVWSLQSATRVRMEALEHAGSLYVASNNQLEELALPSLVDVDGDFRFDFNPAYPTCAAEALRDRVEAASGIGGTISITGNDDTADCP